MKTTKDNAAKNCGKAEQPTMPQYLYQLAELAEVHRCTLWRWLRPHRARLAALGYKQGQPLPQPVIDYICDWFVIYTTF